MVVAQVLECVVGIDTRETAVKHSDADTLSVDALVAESLASHANQLGIKRTVDRGMVGNTGKLDIG